MSDLKEKIVEYLTLKGTEYIFTMDKVTRKDNNKSVPLELETLENNILYHIKHKELETDPVVKNKYAEDPIAFIVNQYVEDVLPILFGYYPPEILKYYQKIGKME